MRGPGVCAPLKTNIFIKNRAGREGECYTYIINRMAVRRTARAAVSEEMRERYVDWKKTGQNSSVRPRRMSMEAMLLLCYKHR